MLGLLVAGRDERDAHYTPRAIGHGWFSRLMRTLFG